MTNETITPEDEAMRAMAAKKKPLLDEMQRLAKNREEHDKLTNAWKKGLKTPAMLEGEVDGQEEKPAVDLHDDRNQPQPTAPAVKPQGAEETKPKPSRRGTKVGADLIQERWSTFEQSQAKALDSMRDLEVKRDEAQVGLDKFNEKHGDYLSKSIKQATGGDMELIKHYNKLREQQQALEKGVAGHDKILEQSRDRYQRDHHEFHADAWGRIRQQAEAMGQTEFIPKAESMSQEHSQASQEFSKKLPADEGVKYTRSLTEQNVEEHQRISKDLKDRAAHDPALQRDIEQGREQVKKIGEDTAQRRAERQEERLPGHNHKHKQSI